MITIIHLSYGTPTISKLRIRKASEMLVTHLRLSNKATKFSIFESSNSHFRIKFPEGINYFDEASKFGVSLISFPNRFKSFPSYIHSHPIEIYLSDPTSKYITLPSGLISETFITEHPKSYFDSSRKFMAELDLFILQ